MKAKITLLLVVCFALTSCSKWYHWKEHHKDDDDGGGNEERQTVEISDNQIIVRFEPGVSEDDRKKLRNDFGVGENYELCSCGDKNLELWGIDPGAFNIEGVVGALKGESRAEGDFQFSFETPRVPGYETLGGAGQFPTGLISFSSNPDIVDIAVLDTGIDYGQEFTPTPNSAPYLYGTSGLNDCPSFLGWNFADGNDEVVDDNGHGTFVTKIITTTLDSKSIGYRILPVKLFDFDGQGSYWNVLCGFGYVQSIIEGGGNIDIVNASFGGTIEDQLFDDKGLLNTMIDELGDKGVLVVTSAGNEGIDTDGGPLKHFPSGYSADNIMAVGGYEFDTNGDAVIYLGPPGSNYGIQSIDVAAPFDGWTVELKFSDANLDGTSFSTAYVTGLSAAFFIDKGRPNPIQLKSEFLNGADIKISEELKPDINEGRYVER